MDGGMNWTEANLSGLIVTSIVISGSTILASTSDNWVFRTTNSGATWVSADSGLPNRDVHGLSVSGTKVYGGTYNGSVYLSTNDGLSWTQKAANLSRSPVKDVASIGPNLIAATYGDGVFLSTNDGLDWTHGGLPGAEVNDLLVRDSLIFAGTFGQGVHKSSRCQSTSRLYHEFQQSI
jgi:photosystem II stability/assembly factor-like uncharacterized protein